MANTFGGENDARNSGYSSTGSLPASLTGTQASSSLVVAFSPADPGTSPTSPDVAALSLDSIFRSDFEQ
jgi:hypothetical protein